MAKQQSHGQCYLCKDTFPKGSMTRHLTSCLVKHEKAAGKGKAKKGKLFHVVVEGKYNPDYWLHLEIPATAKLETLDHFLRDIWLECCGHLSAFKIEGQKRRAVPSLAALLAGEPMDWGDPDELDMEKRLDEVLQKGSKLSYEYDFGSTTKLTLKVVGEREGLVETANGVRLLARNDPPNILCARCKKAQATIIDMEDTNEWLCDQCAEQVGLTDDDMTLPVVNSPRTGVCGYTGD